MKLEELEGTAQALVAKGKGILAADESLPTVKKRFDSVGIESTEETRRRYRELFFTTPGMESYISGVILFDETIRQQTSDRKPFPGLLAARGIIPGIKVDRGTTSLPAYPGEKVTEGLDGLKERFMTYRELGARFTKWRAVIAIGPGIPTPHDIAVNSRVLARFAALSQEAGLLPIVEPEVLMDGNHDIAQCEAATEATLSSVFAELKAARVALEGMLLKTNMVLSGKESPQQTGVAEVAEATLRVLRRTVPAALPGVVFLSGGQSAELATARLNAMNGRGPHPWELSFSFARALQEPALKIWKGDDANFAAAQMAFLHRARCNSAARSGRYSEEMEREIRKEAA